MKCVINVCLFYHVDLRCPLCYTNDGPVMQFLSCSTSGRTLINALFISLRELATKGDAKMKDYEHAETGIYYRPLRECELGAINSKQSQRPHCIRVILYKSSIATNKIQGVFSMII